MDWKQQSRALLVLLLIVTSGLVHAAHSFRLRYSEPVNAPGEGRFSKLVETEGGCLDAACNHLLIRQVYWGDFNGDRIADLLYRGTNWTLLPGTKKGTFGNPVKSFGTCGGTSCAHLVDNEIHLGDFNGDDIIDVLHRGNHFRVWLGTKSGRFSDPVSSLNDCYSGSCQHLKYEDTFSADFNGDGITDILHLGQNLTVWRGTEKGEFHEAVETTGGCGEQSCDKLDHRLFRSGDFNGDDIRDILFRGSNLTVWLGTKSGKFQRPKETSGGCYESRCDYLHTSKLHIGDFNGDGLDDVLYRDRNFSVHMGREDGTFTHPIESVSGCGSTSCAGLDWRRLRIGDFTGDTISDVLYFGNNLTIWRGTEEGRLPSPVESYGGCGSSACNKLHNYNLHIGDFNGDQLLDVLHRDNNLEVWLAEDGQI